MADIQVRHCDISKRIKDLLVVSGVDRITPEVLIEVSDLCREQFKACKDDGYLKMFWLDMQRKTEALVNNDLCPDKGVKVLGVIMTDDVSFPTKGETVRVKKGAMVNSYHSKHNDGPKPLSRSQNVEVSSVITGYIDAYDRYRIVQPEVRWAGTGGYWHWVSPDDIERL